MKPMKRLMALLLCLACLTPAALAAAGMENFQENVPYAGFSDVKDTDWFYADVKRVCQLGLMNGKGDGAAFDPKGDITLAEAVHIAAKVRAAYWEDDSFTPGGDPWYANSLRYALDNGIVMTGEYKDYTAKATKADLAGIFAFALPGETYTRRNRVASIPDVDYTTAYSDYIYLLYSAGILSGDTSGAFNPNGEITRAEVAAIVGRLAVPAARKTLALNTPKPGQVVYGPNSSFGVSLPDGWTAALDGTGAPRQLTAQSADGKLTLAVYSYDKTASGHADLGEFSLDYAAKQTAAGAELVTEPFYSYPRGLIASELNYYTPADALVWAVLTENSTGYYAVELTRSADTTDEVWDEMQLVFDGFNLGL